MPLATAETIAIRPADADEQRRLARLAALDSAAPLRGEVLVALVDGEIRAALSVTDGRAVADPFRPTAGLVELLRTRARLLGGSDVPEPRPSLRGSLRHVALAR